MLRFRVRSAVLIVFVILAATVPLQAVPVEYQDSAAFTYRYEFGNVDPSNPAQIDLDGNGLPDLQPWQSPTLNSTAGTVEFDPLGTYSDSYLSNVFDTTTIWGGADMGIDVNSGYTIEFRMKVGEPTPGNSYSGGVLASAYGSGKEFWLVYGPDGQDWGAWGTVDLGDNDNAADFHTFRVSSSPGGKDYWVWRDGQLLNPDSLPLSVGSGGGDARMAFGGIGSHCLGSAEYDYFRFTPGAYLPPGADPIPEPPKLPIAVEKEIYVAHTQAGVGVWVQSREITRSVREERHYNMIVNDTPQDGQWRRTTDNGATWSDFEPLPEQVFYEEGNRIFWGPWPQIYDAQHDRYVGIWLRQTAGPAGSANQCFARTSKDLGFTWGDLTMLQYEAGADFDPADPFNPDFLNNNHSYFGNSIIQHSNGTLITPLGNIADPSGTSGHNTGMCFIGQWNEQEQDYDWTPSNRVTASPQQISYTYGLQEPDIAELSDGRVLVAWRADPGTESPARKWFSISEDGGHTLGEVQELKYDDGTSFYSPMSYFRFIRHSLTGKLYWIGNITPAPATPGGGPRTPLVIAEVDEVNVALVRDSVTIIDERELGDSHSLSLSNFSVIENRATNEFEVYLMRFGTDPDDSWGSDSYKYTISFADANLIPGDANRDGVVDTADAAILATNWQTTYGASWSVADFNNDGRVDDTDATLLAANWQATAGAQASVPEPSMLILLLTTTVGCVLARTVTDYYFGYP